MEQPLRFQDTMNEIMEARLRVREAEIRASQERQATNPPISDGPSRYEADHLTDATAAAEADHESMSFAEVLAAARRRVTLPPLDIRNIPPVTPPVATVDPPDPDAHWARQASIPLRIPNTVAIVGCGGVGSWLAYFLALAGVPELLLFDSDTVSESNLNRMPYGQTLPECCGETVSKSTVGMKKNDALAQFLKERRPGMTIEKHPNLTPEFAEALKLQAKVHMWLAVSTDTWRSRRAIYQFAVEFGLPYIEAAAEGDFGSIALSPADWATPLEDAPGYASVPVWVGPCVSAATMACSYILHRGEHDSDTSARFGWDKDHISFSYHSEKPPAVESKKEVA
jgi:hypothetical protein